MNSDAQISLEFDINWVWLCMIFFLSLTHQNIVFVKEDRIVLLLSMYHIDVNERSLLMRVYICFRAQIFSMFVIKTVFNTYFMRLVKEYKSM